MIVVCYPAGYARTWHADPSEVPVAGRLIISVTTRLPSRDGGIWAKFIMVSVAMIYFGRLSLTALSHKEELPVAFEAYKMPKWWRAYRHAGVEGKRRQRCICSGSVYNISSRLWVGVISLVRFHQRPFRRAFSSRVLLSRVTRE